MTDSLIQSNAETKVLEYKLDRIRNFIEDRISIVDSITKNELSIVLQMIGEYENVPAGWQLSKPFVENIFKEVDE